MQSFERIPCTVVTGFLGAGKTTLIRNLIEQSAGRRIAIIVNEFGDVGMDGEILKSCGVENCDEEDVVELSNGCICCTVADDFVPALEKVLSRSPKVDQILIETSGLALPKPLVQAFQWPEVKSRVTVDAVIAVVDGPALAAGDVTGNREALLKQRKADDSIDHDDPIEEVFEDQVACADLVVLSKSDLLDDAARARAASVIERHLPRAVKIVPASNGRVDISAVLGLGLAVEDDIENRKTHHDEEEDHDHDEFETFVINLPAITDPNVLAQKVASAAEAENVLRLKGFAHVEGKPMRLLMQAVGPRVAHHYDRAWRPDEEKATQLVVIGLKGLDRSAIESILTV